MIGKLTGIVDEIFEDRLILNVNDVGYVVYSSSKNLQNLNGSNGKISFIIETIVKEDSITLYGFVNMIEKAWFSKLTTVKGVGPKMALSILSIFTDSELFATISAQDKTSLTRVSGVGPRLAERIISELKNSIDAFVGKITPQHIENKPSSTTVNLDAVSALCNLGYAKFDAEKSVAKIISNSKDELSIGEIIKLSLKELTKGQR